MRRRFVNGSVAALTTLIGGLVATKLLRAEELSGVVQIVGSSYNSKVILESAETKSPSLCRNEIRKRIARLTSMSVKVQGDWQKNKAGDNECFAAVDFLITKTSSGRAAIVGDLIQFEGRYQITDESGKTYKLRDLSTGLKNLSGKKVILDLNIINSPSTQEGSYKVVSYAEMP